MDPLEEKGGAGWGQGGAGCHHWSLSTGPGGGHSGPSPGHVESWSPGHNPVVDVSASHPCLGCQAEQGPGVSPNLFPSIL